MPPRHLQDPSRPESTRTSFVNMLSFGQASKHAGQLHHSASAGNLRHGLPSPTTPIERDYADNPSRADSSLQLPAEPKPTYPPRRHPYAYAPPFQPKLPPMPPIKLTAADQPPAKGHGPTSKFSSDLKTEYNFHRALVWTAVMTSLSHLDPNFASVFAIEAVNEPITNAAQTPNYGTLQKDFVDTVRAVELVLGIPVPGVQLDTASPTSVRACGALAAADSG
ncbi:hypothetical protein B0H21DRAFT_865650 [Amylocystis lapponica]|nr:hypothetical protein B0H21DRAFT_865650 [Amylocystis lapponica]